MVSIRPIGYLARITLGEGAHALRSEPEDILNDGLFPGMPRIGFREKAEIPRNSKQAKDSGAIGLQM